jgi:hypothetical protein
LTLITGTITIFDFNHPRSVLTVPFQSWIGAWLITAFATFVLEYVDPKYLEQGKLATVLNPKSS